MSLGIKTTLGILEFHLEDEAEDVDHLFEMVIEGESAVDALKDLASDYDWFPLFDALGSYPCRTREQDALYHAALGLFTLQSYQQLRKEDPKRWKNVAKQPAERPRNVGEPRVFGPEEIYAASHV